MPNPGQNGDSRQGACDAAAARSDGQQPWEEPKLTLIEPKLTKHGALQDVAAGFMGTFTP